MSQIAKKIAGTFVPEEPRPPVHAWIQSILRNPVTILGQRVHEFMSGQKEPLDPKTLLVESIHEDKFVCRCPCMVSDHESVSLFRADVRFEVNPVSGVVLRLEPDAAS